MGEMVLTSQQIEEVRFWRHTFATEGLGDPSFFYIGRHCWGEFLTRTFTDEISEEKGLGLDCGRGPVSVLWHGLNSTRIIAIDDLLDEYAKITPRPSGIEYRLGNGEALDFGDGTFDFACCFNVIDHTPHPEKMLSELRRVLKPGGHLYFWVNFDPALYPTHYEQWTYETVAARLSAFKMLRGTVEWWEKHQKYYFAGMFQK